MIRREEKEKIAHQIAWEYTKHYDPLLSKECWCEMAAKEAINWADKHPREGLVDIEKVYEFQNKENFTDFLDRMNTLIKENEKKGNTIVRIEDIKSAFPELIENEDENIRGAIIEHLKDNNLIEWAAWLEKQGVHELYSQREGCMDCQMNYAGEFRVQPQPKNEWSKEDERMREHIISDLREFRECETDEILISDYEDEISWLKSLRPQSRWKPTKKQIDTIGMAIEFVTDFSDNPKLSETLKVLQNQLKAL